MDGRPLEKDRIQNPKNEDFAYAEPYLEHWYNVNKPKAKPRGRAAQVVTAPGAPPSPGTQSQGTGTPSSMQGQPSTPPGKGWGEPSSSNQRPNTGGSGNYYQGTPAHGNAMGMLSRLREVGVRSTFFGPPPPQYDAHSHFHESTKAL